MSIGRIAQAIVDACNQYDGVLSLEDLEVSRLSFSFIFNLIIILLFVLVVIFFP